MQTLMMILLVLIAIQHLGFMYLEMFLWTKDKGRKVFGSPSVRVVATFSKKSHSLRWVNHERK